MKRCLILLCAAFLLLIGMAFGEETTVIDNDHVSIRILGFEENLLSYNMSVALENKTDTLLTFSMNDTNVNGTEVTLLWGVEVPPHSEKKSAVSWYDLHTLGIDDILVIGGTFRAYDKENWSLPDAASQKFVVYPQEDNHVVIVDPEKKAGEAVSVVDDDQFLITVDSFTNSSFLYCYGLSVSLENRTENAVMFTVRDVEVNGKPCNPYWASEIAAGDRKTETIGWFADTFEENGIELVHEIKMTFVAYDPGTLNAEYQLEQTVTLNP